MAGRVRDLAAFMSTMTIEMHVTPSLITAAEKEHIRLRDNDDAVVASVDVTHTADQDCQ